MSDDPIRVAEHAFGAPKRRSGPAAHEYEDDSPYDNRHVVMTQSIMGIVIVASGILCMYMAVYVDANSVHNMRMLYAIMAAYAIVTVMLLFGIINC